MVCFILFSNVHDTCNYFLHTKYGKVIDCHAQEKGLSERNSHTKKRGGENLIHNQVMYTKNIISRVGSYFQIGGNSVTQTQLKRC